MKVTLILDNLRSVHNVGSLFRTANALGVDTILLCGITPTPLDKKGNKRKDFAKVALGAEDTITWEYVEHTRDAIERMHASGSYVIAIEQDDRAVDYKSVTIDGKDNITFVIGAEVDGIQPETLAACDVIAEIPMLGTKESLNVTIAAGVAMYRILGL